jgi:hypothetical protein
VDVEGRGVAHVVGTPDTVDQLHPGEEAAGIALQHLQELELLEGQLHGAARQSRTANPTTRSGPSDTRPISPDRVSRDRSVGNVKDLGWHCGTSSAPL